MAYLELKNVSFSYPNGYEAVRNVNLSFECGESVAIIGENGAGKTTTVKLMNRLLVPTSGEVIVDGKSTKSSTTAQISKHVGYVFQNPDDQIFQDSIYKEISYGLKKMKLSKQEIDERTKKAAEICGLLDMLDEHPYNLPYSKRKFITIAVIIAMDPQVIILDEPTAGQDKHSTKELRNIIDYLVSQNKVVITITHDMEFVVDQFERVIVMAEKEVRRDSNPKDIFWDKELLKLSSLEQPYICKLADKLGKTDIMTIEDLLNSK